MSLVTTKDLMLDAQKNHYAIGAFNAENMEMVQAIIAAAEELRAPVIVQTTPGTLKYASPAMFHAMVAAAASEASVPVVMHLDHGSSYDVWIKMGAPVHPDQALLHYLEYRSVFEVTTDTTMPSPDGELTLSYLLEPHEVRVVHGVFE